MGQQHVGHDQIARRFRAEESEPAEGEGGRVSSACPASPYELRKLPGHASAKILENP
jgi:hypothetical protein